MHLKSLEIIGFKSFAHRTKLNFEKGMTAIVGPNGCGKSNISDAIRWVIGEQSAKALRGAKMEDIIFNGTDSQKPMSMAEVSLTLTDCEEVLKQDFNEITITRRVHRSGEGQYFINKRPCRLKDIQRLFMDTGIGTSSYSILEQGKIDQILSSRPDDRRKVFEEASGITKYLVDKKDAMRKLGHTEDNLLRLEDIIREVKRQIGSLQRQASKAKRYKEIQENLQGYDLYTSRIRLKELDRTIEELSLQVSAITEKFETLKEEVETTEADSTKAREALGQTDIQIEEAMESTAAIRTKGENARQMIAINGERISDIKNHTSRNEKSAADAEEQMLRLKERVAEVDEQVKEAAGAHEAAKAQFDKTTARSSEVESRVSKLRNELNQFRNRSMEVENALAKATNELNTEENRDKANVLRRERLSAEQSEFESVVKNFGNRAEEMQSELDALQNGINQKQEATNALRDQVSEKANTLKEYREGIQKLERDMAGRAAQLEMLLKEERAAEEFPGGARLLMDENLQEAGFDKSHVLGALARQIEAEPGYQEALESCIRSQVDSIILENQEDLKLALGILEHRKEGSARLIAVNTANPVTTHEGQGTPLLVKVKCPDNITPLVTRLLGHVFVVDSLAEVKGTVNPELTFVTRNGSLMRGDGTAEFRMREDEKSNPLARRHHIQLCETEIAELKEQIRLRREQLDALTADEGSVQEARETARQELNTLRQTLASKKGEAQVTLKQINQAKSRLETVTFELNTLLESTSEHTQKKSDLANSIEELRKQQVLVREKLHECTEAQKDLDDERTEVMGALGNDRMKLGEATNLVQNMNNRREPMQERMRELEKLREEQERDITGYQQKIVQLEQQIKDAQASIEPLDEQLKANQLKLEQLRTGRREQLQLVEKSNQELNIKRRSMDEMRTQKSRWDIQLAEENLRRQNLEERIEGSYHMTLDELHGVKDPEWEDGVIPPLADLEKEVAELRTKLEKMGPVNLVAIEEYAELEERFQFLLQQQEDLTTAKANLLEMIAKINETTTEMFTKTFDQVNENFQGLFKRLFGQGASAKLVLVDQEDVLNSGIEIIARPPGKKLQTISLLSGGERTMTAVGLLFSLYMVKHSPFCVLDELDAALDDANIGRFVDVVRSFVEGSQFIVITHNQRTISAADVLYGVTMQRKGISETVSVKLRDYNDDQSKALAGTKNSKG